MPIDIKTDLYRATLVFDATGYKDAEGRPVLRETFAEMLRPKEYWYRDSDEFSYLKENAESLFYDDLEKRLNEHLLFKTSLHYNLFFYEKLSELDEERTTRLIGFIRGIHLRLGGNNSDLHSYLVVSKQHQDTAEDMANMDRLVDLLLAGNDRELPKLMIVDALPLESVNASLRATVRVATVLSRNGSLSQRLSELDRDEKTVWNWTMTEFDEDELEKINEELDRLKRIVDSHEDFPVGTMESNFQKVWTAEQERVMERPVLSCGMPIPAECVRQGLFGGNKAKAACGSFERILRDTFVLNAQERYFKPFTRAEVQSICERMTRDIPLNYWKDIGARFKDLHRGANALFTPPTVTLNAQGSVSQMQERVAEQIKAMNVAAKKYYPEYIATVIMGNMDAYVLGDEARKVRDEMEDRMMDLQHRIQDNANIGDGKQYLNQCISLNLSKIALRYSSYWNLVHVSLVSNRIASDWDKYENVCPMELEEKDIFNFLDLQEYEFQTLTLITLRKEEYEKSRLAVFHQGGK